MNVHRLKGNTWTLTGGQAVIPVYRIDRSRCILPDSAAAEEREDFAAAPDRLEKEQAAACLAALSPLLSGTGMADRNGMRGKGENAPWERRF